MSTAYPDYDLSYEHLHRAAGNVHPEGALPFTKRARWTPLLFLPAVFCAAYRGWTAAIPL